MKGSIFVLFYLFIISFASATKPNIIFIFADDYGWHDVGYHGSDIMTPNIDHLALTGVRLENYYVQPVCSPTRSQFMVGRYQIRTGLQHHVLLLDQAAGLPLEFPTVADKLRDVGYRTHAVGKWHLGFFTEDYFPTRRGFDTFFGFLGGAEDYYTRVSSTYYGPHFSGSDLRDNETFYNETETYSPFLYTSRVKSIFEDHAHTTPEKPFFLYLPFQSVHSPLQVPSNYSDLYDFIEDENRRTFAGMTTCMDEVIGDIVQSLKDNNLYNNSIIVLSTDNGGQTLQGGNNWPLRGRKMTYWEGGMRGVGFVHSPLLPEAARGTANHEFIHVSDWFPTLVGTLGGADLPKGLDGFDQWGTIIGKNKSPRKELLHNIDPMYPTLVHPSDSTLLSYMEANEESPFNTACRAAIRYGDWKLMTGDPGPDGWYPPPEFNNVELPSASEYTYSDIKLYNISHDPLEKMDVSGEFPDVVQFLLGRLAFYNASAVPVNFPEIDNRSNPALHGDIWSPWIY